MLMMSVRRDFEGECVAHTSEVEPQLDKDYANRVGYSENSAGYSRAMARIPDLQALSSADRYVDR